MFDEFDSRAKTLQMVDGKLVIQYFDTVPQEWFDKDKAVPMGDRFYMQQQKPKRSSAARTPAEPAVKKMSKADLVNELKKWVQADLSAMLQADLQALLDHFKAGANRLPSHYVPTGRLKQPWVDCLNTLLTVKVDWSRLTVANMKAVYDSITPAE